MNFKNKTAGVAPILVGQGDKDKAPFKGVEQGMGEKDKAPFQIKVPNVK